MSEPRDRDLTRIRRASRRVELRMRVARAVKVLPLALAALLAGLAAVLAAEQLGAHLLDDPLTARLLLAAAAAALIAMLLATLARLPPRAGALALDRAHALEGRLANALAFADLPAATRTPLMEAAIDDACARAAALDLRVAAASPLGAPRASVAVLALSLPLVGLALFAVRAPAASPPPPLPTPIVLVPILPPDDAEAFDGMARSLDAADRGPEMRLALLRLRALVRDLARGRIDRAAAFRRMSEIERSLAAVPPADAPAAAALRRTVDDLRDRIRQIEPAGEGGLRRARAFARRARGTSTAADGTDASDSEGDPGEDVAASPPDRAPEPPPTANPDPPLPPPGPIDPTPGPGPVARTPSPPPAPSTPPDIRGAGQMPGPEIRGPRTVSTAESFNTRARARDTGQGPIKNRVIIAAAERGFRGAPYADVFRQYSSYLEDHIGKDHIPPGYRFYIRRYFQLIRARD